MKHIKSMKVSLLAMTLIAGCISLIAVSCAPVEEVNEFEILRAHIDDILADWSPVKKVTDVKAIIDDPAEAAKYTVVSVRSAEHYAKGHVPSAINIPWRSIADEASKTQANGEDVITYCYTGHTGQVAATILKIMGYPAINMKFGMMGWTDDPEVLNTTPFDCNPPNYDTETAENTLPADNELPTIVTGATEPVEIATAQAKAYLGSGAGPVKSVTDVKAIVDDPAEAAKYIIVSVRSAEHYATGHVPGAINIPWRSLAAEENLKKLPADKPIIVYCYTGHTGQVACTVLNLLGYEAYNMKYGMMGWTDDPAVLNTTPFDCNPPNYEVEQ